MKNITFPIVDPRWYQYEFWKRFNQGAQFNIISWPRRAGKDLTTFSIVVNAALQKPGNYYYYFPTGAWAQRALWDNICEWADGKRMVDLLCPPEVVKRKNNTEYFLDLINGSRIKLGGTDNLDFVGQGGAGYVLSEYSLHKGDVTSYLMPILDQSNAWLIANGTMRGRDNHLYKLYENNENRDGWFTQWYTLAHTKTNYWINEEEDICINKELYGKINLETGKPFKNVQDYVDSGAISFIKARQEFLNLADNEVTGAYFSYELGKMEKDKRIKRFGGIDNNRPILTSWDIGGARQDNDDTTAVLWQEFNNKWRIVGFYDESGKSIERDIADVKIMAHGGFFGGHFAPHDAKKTSKQTSLSLIGYAKNEFGFEFRGIPKPDTVKKSIEFCRRQLANVEIDLDGENVPQFLEKFQIYREDPNTGRPDHKSDDSSHAGDGARTGLEAMYRGLFKPYLDRNKRYEEEYAEDDDYSDYLLDNGGTLLV